MADEIITCTVTVQEVDKSGAEEIVGHSLTKEQDMFTNQFGRLLACIIRPVPASTVYAYESGFTDTSGTVFSIGSYYTRTAANRWNYGNPGGTVVAVGTASTEPTRSDYELNARTGPWTKTLISSNYVSSTATVVFAGDVFMSSDHATSGPLIQECGMGFVILDFGGSVRHWLMFAHDSFGTSGVAVASGHFARVTYTIGI